MAGILPVRAEISPVILTHALSGRVFYDQNRNGKIDAGEYGLGGISLLLPDGNRVITEPDGRFHAKFRTDNPTAKVTVDIDSLPGGAHLTTPAEIPVAQSEKDLIVGVFYPLRSQVLSGTSFADDSLGGSFEIPNDVPIKMELTGDGLAFNGHLWKKMADVKSCDVNVVGQDSPKTLTPDRFISFDHPLARETRLQITCGDEKFTALFASVLFKNTHPGANAYAQVARSVTPELDPLRLGLTYIATKGFTISSPSCTPATAPFSVRCSIGETRGTLNFEVANTKDQPVYEFQIPWSTHAETAKAPTAHSVELSFPQYDFESRSPYVFVSGKSNFRELEVNGEKVPRDPNGDFATAIKSKRGTQNLSFRGQYREPVNGENEETFNVKVDVLPEPTALVYLNGVLGLNSANSDFRSNSYSLDPLPNVEAGGAYFLNPHWGVHGEFSTDLLGAGVPNITGQSTQVRHTEYSAHAVYRTAYDSEAYFTPKFMFMAGYFRKSFTPPDSSQFYFSSPLSGLHLRAEMLNQSFPFSFVDSLSRIDAGVAFPLSYGHLLRFEEQLQFPLNGLGKYVGLKPNHYNYGLRYPVFSELKFTVGVRYEMSRSQTYGQTASFTSDTNWGGTLGLLFTY